jgi:hypothetical protein
MIDILLLNVMSLGVMHRQVLLGTPHFRHDRAADIAGCYVDSDEPILRRTDLKENALRRLSANVRSRQPNSAQLCR